jgi:predicted GNAT family N-acyltransferase
VKRKNKMNHGLIMESWRRFLIKENVRSLSSELEKQFNVQLSLSELGDIISINKIIIPEEQRGAGIGSEVMKKIIEYADVNQKIISLTPTEDYGGKKSKLIKFYKKFGFVDNKGKNKNFETTDTMIRNPK